MEGKIIFKTARNFVLEVLDPEADYRTREYTLYLNGAYYVSTDQTILSVYGLKPDTDYEIQLKCGNDVSEIIPVHTDYEYVTLNVKDFGAKGDGITDDTACLQAAVMTVPEHSRVYVPKGTYRFTHLFLKSHMKLELAKDALLLAIPDNEKYPILPGRIESYDEESEFLPASWEGSPTDTYASIITGMYVEDVVIYGQGTIDGAADFHNWWDLNKRKNAPAARPRMMFLNHCKDIVVQGITFRNSPSWNMHPYFSQNLRYLDIRIESPDNSHNTDGIDPESCTNVEIAGVYFSVGDDCIAIKSGKMYLGKTYRTPSKDILVRNCWMERGHGGVTIGSENAGGVDNIFVKNCCFFNTDRGLRVKSRRGRGKDSYLTGITFEHVKMDGVMTPFVINCFYYCGPDGKSEYVACKDPVPVDERTPKVGKISIRNVRCTNCHVAGLYFYGLPESKIESVEMENVYISYAKNAQPGVAAMMTGCEKDSRKGIFVRNAERVTLKNVILEGNSGEALDIEGVDQWSWD
nr:glycoside hydrolase family 28 protein [uncultured Acetatifactor sp.]